MLTVLLCACSIFGRYLCIIDLWSECEQYCCHWGWKNILEISRVYSRAGECYKRSEKEEMEKVNGVFIFFCFLFLQQILMLMAELLPLGIRKPFSTSRASPGSSETTILSIIGKSNYSRKEKERMALIECLSWIFAVSFIIYCRLHSFPYGNIRPIL